MPSSSRHAEGSQRAPHSQTRFGQRTLLALPSAGETPHAYETRWPPFAAASDDACSTRRALPLLRGASALRGESLLPALFAWCLMTSRPCPQLLLANAAVSQIDDLDDPSCV
ncbi:hypothetical protein PSPO01_03297 [Paraphaeosphaeria sporulosa]